MPGSRIQAIDRVTIEAPLGIDDELRWFYREVADLEEVEATLPVSSALIFRSARIELRVVLRTDPRIECNRYRLTLMVTSLEQAAERLDERRVAWSRFCGVPWSDQRLGTVDPAGNRVWLKRSWPDAPL